MKNPNEVIGKFMIGVGALILHPTENKILLIRRDSELNRGTWEFVFGRINQGEELLEALHREVDEEAGIQVTVTKLLRIWHIYRGEKRDENECFGATFVCRALSAKVTISDEHSAFTWVSPKGALELITIAGIKKDVELFLKPDKKAQVILTDINAKSSIL